MKTVGNGAAFTTVVVSNVEVNTQSLKSFKTINMPHWQYRPQWRQSEVAATYDLFT